MKIRIVVWIDGLDNGIAKIRTNGWTGQRAGMVQNRHSKRRENRKMVNKQSGRKTGTWEKVKASSGQHLGKNNSKIVNID